MNLRQVIQDVVNETIVKLKKSGMMKENKKSAFKKTEELLRNYPKLKVAAETNDRTEQTKKLIEIIDVALKSIENDPYYEIIELIFWEHITREHIAEMFDVEVKTVTRNKNRLVNQLKIIIFSDDVIKELFL